MYKYGNVKIYMYKIINVKNVKEYVKKENIYLKYSKVTSSKTLTKKQIIQTKKKYIKATNIKKWV